MEIVDFSLLEYHTQSRVYPYSGTSNHYVSSHFYCNSLVK